jgi:hypothetical protein
MTLLQKRWAKIASPGSTYTFGGLALRPDEGSADSGTAIVFNSQPSSFAR